MEPILTVNNLKTTFYTAGGVYVLPVSVAL